MQEPWDSDILQISCLRVHQLLNSSQKVRTQMPAFHKNEICRIIWGPYPKYTIFITGNDASDFVVSFTPLHFGVRALRIPRLYSAPIQQICSRKSERIGVALMGHANNLFFNNQVIVCTVCLKCKTIYFTILQVDKLRLSLF